VNDERIAQFYGIACEIERVRSRYLDQVLRIDDAPQQTLRMRRERRHVRKHVSAV
jgi:hypothetical protein